MRTLAFALSIVVCAACTAPPRPVTSRRATDSQANATEPSDEKNGRAPRGIDVEPSCRQLLRAQANARVSFPGGTTFRSPNQLHRTTRRRPSAYLPGGFFFAFPTQTLDGLLISFKDGSASIIPRGGATESFAVENRGEMLVKTTWILRFARPLSEAQEHGGVPAPACPPGIYAFDPSSLELRWRYVPDFSWEDSEIQTVEVGGRVFLMIEAPGAADNGRLIALDVDTGGEVWRRVNESRSVRMAAAGGRLILHTWALEALEAVTGRVAWTQSYPGDSSADSFGPEFIVLASTQSRSELALFESSTGSAVSRLKAPDVEPYYLSAGPDVIVHSRTGAYTGGWTAFDGRTGSQRWSTPSVPCGSWIHGAAAGNAMYLCGCDGTLRVIERSSGTQRSELGVGLCSEFAMRGTRLVVGSDDSVGSLTFPLVVELGLFEKPPQKEEVRGRIVDLAGVGAPYRVRIGSRVVTTDRFGRFQATVEGRGAYLVQAIELGDVHGERDIVVLDGIADPAIDLKLTPPLEH